MRYKYRGELDASAIISKMEQVQIEGTYIIKGRAIQSDLHALYICSYGMSGLLFLGFTGFFDDCEMK